MRLATTSRPSGGSCEPCYVVCGSRARAGCRDDCPVVPQLPLGAGGWVFARRRTLTGILIAGGLAGQRHHASFHPLLAEAAWSLDALGLALFRMIEPLLPAGSVLVAIDDTPARKLGRKVFGVGMHHDPLLSSRGKAITNWRHSWVILGVIVQFPLWPERAFCLPIQFRLYLNKAAAQRERRAYRSRPELVSVAK